MANTITKRTRLSRRLFLKGLSAAQSTVVVGLPPLVSMFNSHGTAYAASAHRSRSASSSGSTATVSLSATGFPTTLARTTT